MALRLAATTRVPTVSLARPTTPRAATSATARRSVMVSALSTQDELKREAAWKAVTHVKSGHVVGLGTGSTAAFAVDRIGDLLASGELLDIVGVPTSEQTRAQAASRGIPLSTLDEHPSIDVAIDGADEVEPGTLHVVKGRGGALLRERMVEACAAKFVCIVDESKIVEGLGGSRLALPVEIVKFCHGHTLRRISGLEQAREGKARLRRASSDESAPLYETDNGNYIVDFYFQRPVSDPRRLAADLTAIPGVVDHGIFLDMVDTCIVAGKEGVQVLEKSAA